MTAKQKIVSVVGARPQFVKLAPIVQEFAKHDGVEHLIVHTGQHYDAEMSDAFFEQLEIPLPDSNLNVGSGSHGAQTAEMLIKLEKYFVADMPNAVLVYGDTNSTLAAALAAVKLGLPVAHIEAGLRSYNRAMPEEINRIAADRCSDRLYAPTPHAMSILEKENLAERSVFTGDVMRDAVLRNANLADKKSDVIKALGLGGVTYGLVTIHRPVNTTADALKKILSILDKIATEQVPLIFPVHPRTKAVIDSLELKTGPKIRLIKPVPYLDIIQLIQNARLVITDSGGMQKEAAFLKSPCLTIREETEWIETVEIGVNRLVEADQDELSSAVKSVLEADNMFNSDVQAAITHHFGSGNAAKKIVHDCLEWLS